MSPERMMRGGSQSRFAAVYTLSGVVLCMIVSMLGCTFPVVQPGTMTAVIATQIPLRTATALVLSFSLTPPSATPTPTASDTPTATATPTSTFTATDTPTPLPTETLVPTLDSPYLNESHLLNGVCYAYLEKLVGTTLRWDSDGDLRDFYNAVDESEKCPERVQRQKFDFTDQQLIGTVIKGRGCSLMLTYSNTEETDDTRTITVNTTIIGDCPYGLLEPLVLAVKRSDKRTKLTVTK